MTVKELIQALSSLDPDLPVWARGIEGHQTALECIDIYEESTEVCWPHEPRPKRVLLDG